jgi:multicomponent Na+:H+ antiporter subunit B
MTTPETRQRTLLLEMTTRALFPTVLVFSLYLLLVGHYGPGGGFAAGLVAGLAFVLRYIAGVGSGVRVRPPVLIGLGLTVALLTALAPTLVGAPVLATTKLALDLPVLGHVETQTSLFLDVGVYLLIIGVVLDLLRSLGAGIERDMREAR